MPQSSNDSIIPLAVVLANFRSLLVHGKYPSSSPLHCCLSHFSSSSRGLDPSRVARPIFITGRSRQALIEDLIESNEKWLTCNSGLGATASLLSQIRIFYPETSDHCLFLFSLLQCGVPQDPELAFPNPNIYLDPPVSLVVLHEPSAYVLDGDQPNSYTLHSYLRLITSALALVRFLGGATGTPAFALFDSRIEELSLPILPIIQSDQIEDKSQNTLEHANKALLAVAKYFEQTGQIERGPELIELTEHRTHLFSAKLERDTASLLYDWQWRPVRFD